MSFKEILRFFRALEQGIFAAKPKDNDIDVEAVENEDSIEAVVSHKHTIPVIKHKQAFSLAESIPKSLNIVNKKFEDPVDKEPLARVMEKNSKLHHKHGLSNFEFNTKFIKATEVKITDLDKKAVQHISISLPEEHEFIKGKLNTCVDAIQNFAQELIKQITMPTKPVSINIEFQEEYELINKEKLNNLVNKIQEFSHNLINQMVDNKSEPKIELETQATHNEEYELVDKEKLNTIINEIRKFSHHLIEQMVNTKAETSVLNNKPEPKIELKTQEIYNEEYELVNKDKLNALVNDIQKFSHDLIAQIVNANPQPDHNEPAPLEAEIPVPPPLPPKKVLISVPSVQKSNEKSDAEVIHSKGKAKLELDSVAAEKEDDLRQGQQQRQDDNADEIERNEILRNLMDEIKNFNKDALKKTPVNNEPKAQTPHDALMAQIPAAAKQLKNVADPDSVRAQKIQAIEEGALNRPLNPREELMKAIREHGKINNVQKAEEVYLNDAQLANDLQLPVETNKVEENKNPLINNNFVEQNEPNPATIVIPALPPLPPKKVMAPTIEVKPNNILLDEISLNEKSKSDKPVSVDLLNKNESAEDDLRQGQQEQQEEDAEKKMMFADLLDGIKNFDRNGLKKAPVNTAPKAQTAHDALIAQIPAAAKQLKNVADPDMVRAQKIQAIEEGNPNRPLNAREELMKAIREHGKINNVQKAEEVYLNDAKLANDSQSPVETNKVEENKNPLINNNFSEQNEPNPATVVIPVPPPLPPKKVLTPAVAKSNEKAQADVILNKGKAKLELAQIEAEETTLPEKSEVDKRVHFDLSNQDESEDDLRQGKQQQQANDTDDVERNGILRDLMDEIHHFNKDVLKKTPVDNEPKAQTPHDALMAQIPAAAKQLKNVADPDSVRAPKIQAIEEGNPNRPLNPREELMKSIREQGKLNKAQDPEDTKLKDTKVANDASSIEVSENAENKEKEKIALEHSATMDENPNNVNLEADRYHDAAKAEPNQVVNTIPAPPPLPPKKGLTPAFSTPKNKLETEESARPNEVEVSIEGNKVKPNAALQKLKAMDESANARAATMEQIVNGVKLKKVDTPKPVALKTDATSAAEILKNKIEQQLPTQHAETIEQKILTNKCSKVSQLVLEKLGQVDPDSKANYENKIKEQLPEEIKSVLTEDEFFGVEEDNLVDNWNDAHTKAVVEKIATNLLQQEISELQHEVKTVPTAPATNVKYASIVDKSISDALVKGVLGRRLQIEDESDSDDDMDMDDDFEDNSHRPVTQSPVNKLHDVQADLSTKKSSVDSDAGTKDNAIKIHDVLHDGGVPALKASSDALVTSDVLSGQSDLVDSSMHAPSPISHDIPGFELDYHQAQLHT